MAEIKTLPGINRPDIVEPLSAAKVLARALELNLLDAVVIGRNGRGDIEVLSTQPDTDTVVGLMMRGVQYLTKAAQIQYDGE